jgi:prepilin signal peptidase PulO-like enzyme (type II secretory pathway)
MMEASTVPVPSVAEPRRELRDLLPMGRLGVAVGLLGAGLAIASLVDFGMSGRALVGVVVCPVLVLLAAIDTKHRLLPNAIVFPSVLLVALIVAAADPAGFFDHLWAGLALFGFLFLFAAISRAGLGMGDAKVGLLIGLALGSRTFAAMVATSAAAFVAALWILARQGPAARKQSIPFGPYLALGAILAFFFA